MTANELADKLQNEKAKTLLYVATIVDSANMLRQQQAEIEALKQRLELAEWDEETWKKFKKDNYEVIELKPRSEK